MNPARRALALGLCLVLGSCIEDLDRKSLVRYPRVLDIIAEPPEVNPGGTITFRVITGGVRETPTFRWVACVSPDPTGLPFGTSGFGTASSEVGCFSEAGVGSVPLGTGETARFTIPARTLENIDLLASRFGQRLQEGTLRTLARDVGIVLGVGVTMETGGTVARAYKRVVVSLSTTPNRNPPPPRFRVGTTLLVPSSERDRCEPEGGGALRVRAGQRVALAPDTMEETWFEPFRALTATGDFQDRRESAFYSWYVTGGSLARDLTRNPTRNNEWAAPAEPGAYDLWLLVRDGRGGSSGCRAAVTVE
ncbi:MAG: hypothetical protein HY909_28245 [Deltaproteobacteria bacterium]|nr:hypothetical protein [Deltaproteobacteria bacterium]